MRKWLYEALCQVLLEGKYSNLYLKNHLKDCPKKDQALATRIFYGTLQNYGFLNYCVDQYVNKKIPMRIRILLIMSLYQLFYLDKVPAYAIVNEAVELAKQTHQNFAGLVNAVLHRADLNTIQLPENEEEKLSIQSSLPLWLIKMWKSQYGFEKTCEMAMSSLQILPIYVRRNPLCSTREEFDTDDFSYVHDELYIYHGNDVSSHSFYRSGKMSVQDAGSYQIAQFVNAQKGMSVLDCCAAPGTKSMAMAESMQDQGMILCLDIHAHRVSLIERDAQRLHLHCIHTQCMDATKMEGLGSFDRILCDVPCSGYGVLARKPDIKITMKSEDMDSLIPVQRKILESCASHVKEKGQLIYSTCTVNKKENEKQVEYFLNSHPEFSLIDEKMIFPTLSQDGFYMAKLEKKGTDLI